MKNQTNTRFLTQSGAIAAVYVLLTMLAAALGLDSGAVQLRLSEALTILPVFTPAAVPGLFIGCLLSNLLAGGVIWDVIFGSLATLIAAIGTYLLRKKPLLAASCPVLANAVIVGLVLSLTNGWPVALTMLEVGAGEVAAVALGMLVLLPALKRIDLTKYF